ncbi:hypothetical protein jhhlp_008369 [Lomentospora prolificans]|uniref:CENP-V/GFA domain-containing protein n=1 Tax=Lomentospora prolificans TaxID=41688 RepID=A0A2N3MXV2_9PEZI|nr:hypothetical protein jhhlp_008369 [Lomentospora prolificans]
MASNSSDLGSLPKKITGSCPCGRIAYRIDFPENHPFSDNSDTCQCTQCRKSTSSLFFIYQKVPYSSLTWTTPTDTFQNYYCTDGNARGLCRECGTFMYRRRAVSETVKFWRLLACCRSRLL